MNLLIVEDEAILAMTLTDHLEAEGYTVIGVANNGTKAIQLFNEHSVDLLLCDITIKGDFDGIETARRINVIRPVPVIYLTAYSDADTVSRAKQTFPAAYLTKPYNLTNLRLAIEIAFNNLNGTDRPPTATPTAGEVANREAILKMGGHIFIKQGYQFIKISIKDIQTLEANESYTTLYTTTTTYSLRLSLAAVLEKIEPSPLVRVHRSYAVNLEHIDTFGETEISVGTHVIPIGRNYKEQFLSRLYK